MRAAIVLALLVAACGSTVPTGSLDQPGASVSSAAPSPRVYYEATKNAEGGHDGPPLLVFPAVVIVDYTAVGTCDFTLAFQPSAGPAIQPVLLVHVSGRRTDSVRVELAPGSYYPAAGEAVGCTYTLEIRAPG